MDFRDGITGGRKDESGDGSYDPKLIDLSQTLSIVAIYPARSGDKAKSIQTTREN